MGARHKGRGPKNLTAAHLMGASYKGRGLKNLTASAHAVSVGSCVPDAEGPQVISHAMSKHIIEAARLTPGWGACGSDIASTVGGASIMLDPASIQQTKEKIEGYYY